VPTPDSYIEHGSATDDLAVKGEITGPPKLFYFNDDLFLYIICLSVDLKKFSIQQQNQNYRTLMRLTH